jgi:hypothetical protein
MSHAVMTDSGPAPSVRLQRVALTGLVAAIAVAVIDLLTGWESRLFSLAWVAFIGLFLFAVALWITWMIAGSRDRRWILAGGGDALNVLRLAARSTRWSSVFAAGVSVLLFANCSVGISSSSSPGAPENALTDPAGYLAIAALVVLPLLIALAVPGGLATAAYVLASRGRLRGASKAASLAIWSAGAAAIVAFVTTGLSFFVGVAQCDVGPSIGGCAAGAGGLLNLLAISSLAFFVPYIALMNRVLSAMARKPGPTP